MIEPRHPALPVSRQCALLGISRSTWYGSRKGENPLNLALMRLIDAQFSRRRGTGVARWRAISVAKAMSSGASGFGG